MKANSSYQRRGSRRRIGGAIATPSVAVVPVQRDSPSAATIETRAPATGAAVSSRVTNSSVPCGLSLTLIARLVTCTTVARSIGDSSRRRDARDCAIGSPSSTAAQTIPVPDGLSVAERSRPCDWMRSAVRPRRRCTAGTSGARRNPEPCSRCSVGISDARSTGADHWRTLRMLRA